MTSSIIGSEPTPLAVPLTRYIAQFYPPVLRDQLEAAAPTLALHAQRLGTEVLLAEREGLRFADAVKRGDFPAMERAYFGAQALLQHRLTPELRDAVCAMIEHGLHGGFDPVRKLLFAVASHRDDADAAMCRFFFWVGVRLNLLAATWDAPEVSAIGTLDEMEIKAEEVLRELLTIAELVEAPDVRPLNILVAEMLVHTDESVTEKLTVAMKEYGAELTEMMTNANALEMVRALDDRRAVTFNPGPFLGQGGSTQIARRYPHLHASANSVEQTRSRQRRGKSPTPVEGERLIDVIRGSDGGSR